MNENIFPIEKTSLPLGRRDTPDHPSVHNAPEALGEVIVKRLHKKKHHPQNIDDARYNNHNDGGGWHNQYIPVVKGRGSRPVKMLLSRMSRSTLGKFVHLVIPFILELELHINEMINLSL
jgi:hypothetical protein